MSEVSKRIALLSKERRALFQALLSASGINSPIICRTDRTGPVPMSYAQQRLWFIDQLEPGNPAYNRPVPLRLKGRLDVRALVQSLQAIIEKHEVLRTTYSM